MSDPIAPVGLREALEQIGQWGHAAGCARSCKARDMESWSPDPLLCAYKHPKGHRCTCGLDAARAALAAGPPEVPEGDELLDLLDAAYERAVAALVEHFTRGGAEDLLAAMEQGGVRIVPAPVLSDRPDPEPVPDAPKEATDV